MMMTPDDADEDDLPGDDDADAAGMTSARIFPGVPVRHYIYDDAIFDCRTGGVFRQSGYLPPARGRRFDKRAALVPELAAAARIVDVGPAGALIGYHSGFRNYFHWMTQCLLGIHLLDQVPECRGLPILLPRLRGFQQQSLTLLGIDQARLLPARLNATYRIGRLHMADTMFAPGGRRAPRQLRDMADHIRDRAGTGASPAGRAIYVSRLDSTRRVMTNERDLIAALEARGIEHVSMGGRPMEEQIAIFAGASLIVAPHGAALTNLIYARPGATLYELLPANYLQTCDRVLADKMALAYHHGTFPVTLDQGHDSTWEVQVDTVVTQAGSLLDALPR